MPRGRPRKKVNEVQGVKETSEHNPHEEKVEVKEDHKPKAATTTSNWSPKPDMGDVKEPEDKDKYCVCEHKGEMHYGNEKRWCNFPNCRCDAWYPK